ncbi:MAG: RHS repeat-associated core domain-containing protein [Candidatus Margulisiibacteriota bacterium]
MEYLYDDSGLLLKQKDPLSGNWQEFSYDGMGRLTQIQFPINGSLRPVVNDIRYNKANLMLGYALPLSNITATQGFDPQNDRIKSIAFTGPTYLSYKNQQNAAILQQMNKLNLPQFNQDSTVTGNALPYFTQTYTYDPAGNRTQLTQKEAADTTQFTYDYDRMNQLVSYAMKVNNADPVEFKYVYDSQGNRTSLTQGTTTLTTDFDTTTNKPNGYWFGAQKNDENHIEFLYDKNGNRLNKQLKTAKNELLLDITYAWNAQNRMTRYTLNGITQANKYQFSGPRYEKKETSPESTETTRYYPDDSLRLLSEKITNPNGQKSYAYIYLGTQKLARISKNAATQKDEISYFLNDALGTPAWITYEHTASPNAPVLISQNLRDPWGNEMGSTLFNQTPVRDFTGKQQDTLSNLYDFGFRYYDSLLGTWIGKDLVPPDYTVPLSLNEHLYALNNPTTYVDQDGRLAVWVGGAGNKANTDGYSIPIVQKMNEAGINAKYVYTPRDDGSPAQLGRAIRSGLNVGQERAVNTIKSSYDRSDGQFNIVGYSMGSVDGAYAAIQLAKEGKTVDNLVLIGSPISNDGKLMQQLMDQPNILNITRYDIKGDFLAPAIDWSNGTSYLSNGGKLDNSPHFYFTDNKVGQQDWLSKDLYNNGIR